MSGNKPNLTLNMDDKIYLAVSKRNTDKLAFVHTLACFKTKGTNKYNLLPTREMHTFKDKDAAKLYHDTISEIIDINMNDKRFKIFFSTNDDIIAKFLENSR